VEFGRDCPFRSKGWKSSRGQANFAKESSRKNLKKKNQGLAETRPTKVSDFRAVPAKKKGVQNRKIKNPGIVDHRAAKSGTSKSGTKGGQNPSKTPRGSNKTQGKHMKQTYNVKYTLGSFSNRNNPGRKVCV